MCDVVTLYFLEVELRGSQCSGFFACVLAACLLCPWNFLFGAFTAVWIGVAVGSVLEEADVAGF